MTPDKHKASVVVAKNSFYLIGGQVVSKTLTFFFYMIIARHLGDTELGKYSFIVSLIGICIVVSNFGLDNLIVRDISQNRKSASTYLSSAIVIKSALALLLIVFLLLTMPVAGKAQDVVWGVYLFSVVLFTEGIATAIEAVFNAFEQLKYVAIIDIIINLAKLIAGLFVSLYHLQLLQLLLCLCVLSILRALISFAILKKKLISRPIRFDFLLLKRLPRLGYSFALMGIISVVYFRIDSIMLSLMKTDSEVGWYAAAFNLLSVLMFISYGFSRAVFPLLSRYYNKSRASFLQVGEKSLNYLLVLGLPIALGIYMLAERIILMIYGHEFINSVAALKILIWTVPLIYVNTPLLRMLYSSHKQNIAMTIGFTSMGINLALNFYLIPKFGYLGTSISTLVSEIFTFLLYYISVARIFSYRIRLNTLSIRSFVALASMAAFLHLFEDLNLFMLLFMSPVLYFFILYKSRALTEGDIALLKNVFQKG